MNIFRYTPVSEDEIIWAKMYLETEPEHIKAESYFRYFEKHPGVNLARPNLTNERENKKRRDAYADIHESFYPYIGPYERNMSWYKTNFLFTPWTKTLTFCNEKSMVPHSLDLNNIILWKFQNSEYYILAEDICKYYYRQCKFCFASVYIGLVDK